MTARRTNSGKMLDMDALMLQGEKEIALGNMKVNARGDKIGAGGKIVKKKEDVAREYYANNPKAVIKSVSIKDAVDNNSTVQDQSENIVGKKATTPKAKVKAKKTVEVELPNGDLELQEIEE